MGDQICEVLFGLFSARWVVEFEKADGLIDICLCILAIDTVNADGISGAYDMGAEPKNEVGEVVGAPDGKKSGVDHEVGEVAFSFIDVGIKLGGGFPVDFKHEGVDFVLADKFPDGVGFEELGLVVAVGRFTKSDDASGIESIDDRFEFFGGGNVGLEGGCVFGEPGQGVGFEG